MIIRNGINPSSISINNDGTIKKIRKVTYKNNVGVEKFLWMPMITVDPVLKGAGELNSLIEFKPEFKEYLFTIEVEGHSGVSLKEPGEESGRLPINPKDGSTLWPTGTRYYIKFLGEVLRSRLVIAQVPSLAVVYPPTPSSNKITFVNYFYDKTLTMTIGGKTSTKEPGTVEGFLPHRTNQPGRWYWSLGTTYTISMDGKIIYTGKVEPSGGGGYA